MADNSPTQIRSTNGDIHDAFFESTWVQEGDDPFKGEVVTNQSVIFAKVSEEYAQEHGMTIHQAITKEVVTGCNGMGYMVSETRTIAVIVEASSWAIIEDNRTQEA